MKEESSRADGCSRAEPLLSSFAAGALDEESERLARDHLAVCASCRDAQMRRDPSVLFLELRRTALPDGFLDGFAAGVRRRLEPGARFPNPFLGSFAAFGTRRLAYVAAPLMTLLLLGTLFLVRPGGPGPRGFHGPGQGAINSPYVVPPGSARLGRVGAQTTPSLPVLPAAPSAGRPGTPPLMEEIGSPRARVYRFTIESDGTETPIYFVVDESIDI